MQNAVEAIVDITDPSNRPWYMKGGKRRPQPALKNRQTGRRLARLWPDEDAKDDRITNQVKIKKIVLKFLCLNSTAFYLGR